MWHNRIVVALDAQRTALAGPELRDGVRCLVTGTGVEWMRIGSVWKEWNSGWAAYTPSSTGIVPGSGGSAVYQRRFDGGLVEVEFKVVFGGAASVSAGTFALPVACDSSYGSLDFFGNGVVNSDGAGAVMSPIAIGKSGTSSTIVQLYAMGANTLYVTWDLVTLAKPAAMAPNGFWSGKFSYRPA